MMKKFWKINLLIVGGVGAALLVGGMALASNVGFKLVFPLVWQANPTGPDLPVNDFRVSLPYNSPLLTADDILDNAPGATQVARLNPSLSPRFDIWFDGLAQCAATDLNAFAFCASDAECDLSTPGDGLGTCVGKEANFPVETGRGYIIRVNQGTSTSITLVGSHDPSFILNFNPANRPILISVPYHTTWTDSLDMCAAIPYASQVVRRRPEDRGFEVCTCVDPFTDCITLATPFPIQIGEAYQVRVSQTPSVLVPEHY